MSNPIEAGVPAPDFTLKNTRDEEIRLSDLRGKKVLLSWHPLAWTGVCTDQMRSLETNFEKFSELNTVPLGMSIDPVACKKAWAAVLNIKKTDLLSDFWPHGQVAADYGVFTEQKGMSKRANVIVDEAGTVKWVKVYPIAQLPDIQEVLQVLSSL
jgi:peroxiredoxin